MLPIKYRDDDSFLSDFSLISSVDKETQTEPKCITEEIKQVIVTEPGVTGQDIEKVLEYRNILHDTRIIDTNIRIDNIKQHKQGVLSAHSSHGTFIIGNILQREDPVESHQNKYWKLDESIERAFPNSGYVYIPCVQAENDNQEDTSNKVCIFIPNQETREHLENNKKSSFHSSKEKVSARISFISNAVEEQTNLVNPINTSSFHSKASKEKVSAHTSFIDNAVEEQTNLVNPINTSSFHSKAIKEKVSAHTSFIDNAVEEQTNLVNPINISSFHSKASKEKVSAHKSFINNAVEEQTNFVNPINTSSFHSKASKEKVSAHTSFINNAVEEQTHHIDINRNEDMPDKKSSSSHEPCSPSEIRTKRLNNLAQGVKDCLSNTISAIANPICKNICNKPKELRHECTNKIVTEEKIEKIHEIITPKSLETNTPSEGLIAKIRISLASLVCNAINPCIAESKSTIDPPPVHNIVPDIENPTENKEKRSSSQIDKPPENEEKELEKRPSYPNKPRSPVNTYPCPPPPKPRRCSFDMVSTETVESRQITPLINEMSPNNEFVTEDYVFNNNQLTPMNIEVVEKLSEDAKIRTDVNDVVLFAAASNTTDDSSNSNAEYSLNNQDKVHMLENSGLNQKSITVVETTGRDFKRLNLDRISERSERKTEASGTPSSEHVIRMVTPESISHSHTFAQPPRRGLFTAFKSTIFRFFGDKHVTRIDEHSDMSGSSDSYTSSDNSED